MPNIFDGPKKALHNLTARIMGYVAVWSEEMQKINYKGPSSERELSGFDYYPTVPEMEYFDGQFVGLKEAVDAGGNEEVSIETIGIFWVRQVNKKYDGDTYTATLEVKEFYE